MKKKTKYITAAIVFVLLSLCNIFVSAILHKMLIKDNQWLTFAPFIETCKLVFSNMGARSIFLAFDGIYCAWIVSGTAITNIYI